jgi:hypothetical protein
VFGENEVFHEVAAQFFTLLLNPSPKVEPGDFWEETIQKGVFEYFEFRRPESLKTNLRDFLLGEQRAMYICKSIFFYLVAFSLFLLTRFLFVFCLLLG